MTATSKKIAIISLLSLAFFIPNISFGQTGGTGGGVPTDGTGGGSPTGGSGGTGNSPIVNPSDGFRLQNPIAPINSICGLIKKILTFILVIGAPVAALFLAIAGLRFVIARGNPPALKTARENLLNVLIGIFIFMAAWLLGQVIANTLKAISPTNAQAAGACQ